MSLSHAVVWTDHQAAQVLQFDDESVESTKVRTHTHHTKQHGSTVRTEHEFFGDVCAAIEGIDEVLITGSSTSVSDFRHYAEKHRAAVAGHIVGYEIVDKPTENQLVAFAREFFLKHDKMGGGARSS